MARGREVQGGSEGRRDWRELREDEGGRREGGSAGEGGGERSGRREGGKREGEEGEAERDGTFERSPLAVSQRASLPLGEEMQTKERELMMVGKGEEKRVGRGGTFSG